MNRSLRTLKTKPSVHEILNTIQPVRLLSILEPIVELIRKTAIEMDLCRMVAAAKLNGFGFDAVLFIHSSCALR